VSLVHIEGFHPAEGGTAGQVTHRLQVSLGRVVGQAPVKPEGAERRGPDQSNCVSEEVGEGEPHFRHEAAVINAGVRRDPQGDGPEGPVLRQELVRSRSEWPVPRVEAVKGGEPDLEPDERGAVGVAVFFEPIGADKAGTILLGGIADRGQKRFVRGYGEPLGSRDG
jgi:hypothetical protein